LKPDWLAITAWVLAVVAAVVAVAARRALSMRLEDLARASHELRGGIGAARLGLALAGSQGGLVPSRLRAVELELERAALALDELDARPSEWEHRVVDLQELLIDCVEATRAMASTRGVEVGLNWSGGPGVVVGDRVRLAQAAVNLISNAIEHGGGPVEIRAGQAAGAVRIEVLDAGPGLPKSVTELTGHRRGARRRGHGLRIAADIARGHGGRLSAAPTTAGARLVLELPARGGAGLRSHAG
jgi:signal transduction histidine kinase